MTRKKHQIFNNLLTNIFALIANILVGIYYTPYLVSNLGLAAYGVLPLALIINNYISILATTFTNSFSRFYSVALQQRDDNLASKYLSTSVQVIIFILILLSPFFFTLIIYSDNIFNIPNGLITQSKYLFGLSILSFFISLFSSMFNTTLYAQNRLDIMNYIKIARSILKLVILILLFKVYSANIVYVGISGVITELIVLAISVPLFYRFKPQNIKFNVSKFDKIAFYSIMGMAIWTLLQQIGDILLYSTDNFIINHYYGTIASGAVGVITELCNYVKIAVSVISTLFGPIILIAYSNNAHDEVKKLSLHQSLFVGCLTAIIVGIISSLSCSILSIWIDQEFAKYSSWLILKLVILPFYAAGGVLAYVYRSWNRVKFPAIATLLVGCLDIVCLILIPKFLLNENSSILVILSFGVIMGIIQSYFLGIYYINNIYPGIIRKFLSNFCRITLVFIVSYFTSYVLTYYYSAHKIIDVLTVGLISILIVGIITYTLIIDSDERRTIIKLIKN